MNRTERDRTYSNHAEGADDVANPMFRPVELRAADLLVRGHSLTEVGRAVGRTRQTIAAWLKNPTFRAEVDRRSERLCGQAPEVEDVAQRKAQELLLLVAGGAVDAEATRRALAGVLAIEVLRRVQGGRSLTSALQAWRILGG